MEGNLETKSINSMEAISANATRKMLSGDGAILLSEIKTFIVDDVLATVGDISDDLEELASDSAEAAAKIAVIEPKVTQLENSLAALTDKINGITAGSFTFSAVRFALLDADGAPVEDEYGYLVMKKSDKGNLVFKALTQDEYDAIFSTEAADEL